MARPELLRLLQACKDTPHEAPRLILADWVEENGEADRAAFLRLEAAAGHEKGRPELYSLRSKTWADNSKRWAPFAAAVEDECGLHVDTRDGLLETETQAPGLKALEKGGWAGSEAWAWMGRLAVHHDPGELGKLLASPLLPGLGEVMFWGGFLPTDIKALAAWPGLETLAGLSLGGGTTSPLKPLWRSPFLSRLRRLDLQASNIRAADWAALAVALPSLDTLGVMLRRTQGPFADCLAAATWRLRELELYQPVGQRTLDAIASSDACAGLRRLAVGDETDGDFAFDRLAPARFWPVLEELHLHRQTLSPASVRALAKAPAAPRLRVLALGGAGLAGKEAAPLAGSALCAELDYLDLGGNPLGPAGAAALVAMPAAPRTLGLGSCDIGDKGLKALARWPGLARCRVLLLGGNSIGPEGAAALAASPHAAGLVGLQLGWNPIKDEGFRRLRSAAFAGRLEELDVRGCRLAARPGKTPSEFPALKEFGA